MLRAGFDADIVYTGFIVTYVAPLAFVLTVTMGKEAYDDYQRNLRDREANSATYLVLDPTTTAISAGLHTPTRAVPSSALRVGDLVLLEKDQRVPADLVLLRTSDAAGTAFVRTDQLDGETDWKLRVAVPACQALNDDAALLALRAEIYADAPSKDIHTFIGTFTVDNPNPPSIIDEEEDLPMISGPTVEPLSAENVLWANTVLASGSAVGFVIYTGPETRAVMNTSHPQTKSGLLDIEINRLAKVGTFFEGPSVLKFYVIVIVR
jgi:phospholipid-translocating ATPase